MFWKLWYIKNWGNIDNEIEIVDYVTVFIYKIMGTPRSARINRKYQENYAYLEFFTVNIFCRELFFLQHRIVFISNATLLFYGNYFLKNRLFKSIKLAVLQVFNNVTHM